MTLPPFEPHRAHGGPPARGRLRAAPEEFFVDEIPAFTPDGSGEHVLLHIEKRNTNTEWLARQIARFAGVKPMDVGFAGLKDRRAVTRQWFSVYLGNRPEPAWSALEGEELRLLEVARHGRKLRRGALRGNRFRIVVRDLGGDIAELERRLVACAARGVPNYFGEQRFGRDGGNLAAAAAMFAGERVKDRHRRGLYLSAARSHLFNRVLARRVELGNWELPIDGDWLMLAGSHSVFHAERIDDELRARAAAFDLHPTGPLWGRGALPVSGEARALEEAVLAQWGAWRAGLEEAGLKQERRALRLPVTGLEWSFGDGTLELAFSLPAGSYATAVLAELLEAADEGEETAQE